MSDPQDRAEQLDEEVVTDDPDLAGDRYGDGLPDYPPDRPLGVNTIGVTAIEEDTGDSFAERTLREEPDGWLGSRVEHVGELVEPDASTLDDEAQELGDLVDGPEAGPEESAIHIVPDDAV